MSSPDNTPQAQHPFFVYGTLRHGQPNYSLLRGYILEEQAASIQGMRLYSLQAFPLMVEGDGIVSGELITLQPNAYTTLLARLDRLEGYTPGSPNNLFTRKLWQVQIETSSVVSAWIYLGNAAYLKAHHTLIPQGDWIRYRQTLIGQARRGRFNETENDT